MRHLGYFVIRPRQELRDRLAACSEIGGDGFLDPILWVIDQGGRTIWSQNDYSTAVKCLYVAYTNRVVLGEHRSVQIFGQLEVSAQFFDKWWSLEVFGSYDENAEDVARDMSTEGLLDDVEDFGSPFLISLVRNQARSV